MNQHVKVLVASFKVTHHHFIVNTEKSNENLHQDSWSPGKNQISEYTRHGKTLRPNFVRWWEGPKQRFIVQQLYVGCASLQCQSPSKWVLTKGGNQAKPVAYSEKSCYSYQFRADALMYGHWSQYISDNKAAQIVACTQMPGCCCCLNPLQYKIAISK